MRSLTVLFFSLGVVLLTSQELAAQCQRGGAGGSRGASQGSAAFAQTGGFRQNSINPVVAYQLAARQQAYMRQQLAYQQMRVEQTTLQEQDRQSKLARRRESLQRRRAAQLARRRESRAETIARSNERKSKTSYVAFRDT